ncbi:hypothetical protein UFOVP383_58 [uncultured Caudovirales phage]|uniref:Uncharacterized protein n=1 Tax=uncultured Caudovirales phage TaxID=2100421 RepID=A0A6J7X0E2_9CAUD|nr:hypothetical protein UFOVP383_58 [uncultured Caudovirales phage]
MTDHIVDINKKVPLSAAAEAAWEAFNEDEAGVFVDYGDKLAAAFRAAALYLDNDCQQLLTIATKLEGQ